jgi:hypothetical protein
VSDNAAWELAYRAHRRGDVCATCGKRFAPGETAYVRPVQVLCRDFDPPLDYWSYPVQAPECIGCRPAKLFTDLSKPSYPPWLRRECMPRSGPCVGCGRPVVYPRPQFTHGRRHFYCGMRCVEKFHRANRARQERRPKTCAVCGGMFRPRRRDATTCSSVCRQKAYRRRVTDKKLRKREKLSIRNAQES